MPTTTPIVKDERLNELFLPSLSLPLSVVTVVSFVVSVGSVSFSEEPTVLVTLSEEVCESLSDEFGSVSVTEVSGLLVFVDSVVLGGGGEVVADSVVLGGGATVVDED